MSVALAPASRAVGSGEITYGMGSDLVLGEPLRTGMERGCASHPRQRGEGQPPARPVRVLSHFRARLAMDLGAQSSSRDRMEGQPFLLITCNAPTPPAEWGESSRPLPAEEHRERPAPRPTPSHPALPLRHLALDYSVPRPPCLRMVPGSREHLISFP